MNELITPELSELPAMPVNEVKAGVDKIGGYIGMLSAAKKATADQSIIDEVNDQIRKYSALKLRWQMELGRRTAEIPKAPANQYKDATAKTRHMQLADLGIDHRRASENERMASEPEIVEKYIERTIEQDEAPTTSGALKAIREVKNKTLKEKEKETVEKAKEFLNKPKEDKPIANFQDAVNRKEATSIVKKAQAEKAYDHLYHAQRNLLSITSEDIDVMVEHYADKAYILPDPETLEELAMKLTRIAKQIGDIK